MTVDYIKPLKFTVVVIAARCKMNELQCCFGHTPLSVIQQMALFRLVARTMSIEKDRKHLLNNQVMRFDNNRNSSLSKTRRRAVIYVNLGNKAFLIMTIIISSFMCKREMRKSPSIGRSLFKIYSVNATVSRKFSSSFPQRRDHVSISQCHLIVGFFFLFYSFDRKQNQFKTVTEQFLLDRGTKPQFQHLDQKS